VVVFCENKCLERQQNSGGGDRNINLAHCMKIAPATANYFEKTHLVRLKNCVIKYIFSLNRVLKDSQI
jgi:hypothetical protein